MLIPSIILLLFILINYCSSFFPLAITIAPIITALNLQAGKNLTDVPGIRFVIKDELSGISSYKGYIDNEWILMQYDPKNELLFYTFDNSRISNEKNHELELYIEDGKGNKAFYHTTFFR